MHRFRNDQDFSEQDNGDYERLDGREIALTRSIIPVDCLFNEIYSRINTL